MNLNLLLLILGSLMVIEGLPYFISPQRARELLKQVLALKNSTLRYVGLVLIISGLLLVFLVKPGV